MTRGKYTVNEVEERTKVPASTLRQWERRYGFPKPERSESGYRLYSDRDIDHIDAMKRHIADGIPASRAAELVKRLPGQAKGPRPASDLRAELIEALLGLDEGRADDVMSEAHAMHPVETVLEELMKTAMVEIGQKWHDGEITTTTEHFASSYIQGRLRALLSLSNNINHAPAVIVACAPLDQHELGALMLSVLLRRSGYRIYYVGANTPVDDLRDMARSLQPLAVMISASTLDSARQLLEKRSYLDGIAPLLVLGGAVFNDRPELAAELGGHYIGSDAREAVLAFDALAERSRAKAGWGA